MVLHSHLFVAKTLDLLGHKLLDLDAPQQATVYLRESLSIRTQTGTDDLSRINSMVQLARSLARSDKPLEAQSYLEAARKRLTNVPSASNLWSVVERELERL